MYFRVAYNQGISWSADKTHFFSRNTLYSVVWYVVGYWGTSTYRIVSTSRSSQNCHYIMRFQVLTAESMMFRIVFWDVLPCKMIVDRHFRGTCCLHHQGAFHRPYHVPMKRRLTIILHGSTSQKTNLNFILAAVRTWNLTRKYQIQQLYPRSLLQQSDPQ
jgi:hypothetical protein